EHRLGHVVALLGAPKVGLLEDDVLRRRLSNVVLELFLDLRRGGRESVGVGGELLLLLADALLGGGPDAHDLRRGPALDRAGAVRDRLLEPADLAFRLFLDLLEDALALVLVDVRDEVEREVQDPLQVARGHVEQDAETARGALEEPDVRHGRRELDVAHALAAHLRARHLDAALVADDALVPDALVLAAVALPVPRGTEDALVEEPVLFRTERAVVDRLGLRDLAARPRPDLVRRRERDADRVELVY